MAIEVQGKVGIQILQDGVIADPRLGKQAETIVGDVHGHFYESVYRGKVFSASNLPAGIAPGTAFATTPTFCLWNAPNSGVNAVILRATMSYISGTLGAGSIVWGMYAPQTAAPTTGTALAIQNNLIGNPTSGQIKAYNGSTLAGTPIMVRPTGFIMGAFLATTAVLAAPYVDNVDGEIILVPGAALCLAGIAAAGSTPLVQFAASWEEVPV